MIQPFYDTLAHGISTLPLLLISGVKAEELHCVQAASAGVEGDLVGREDPTWRIIRELQVLSNFHL